MATKQIIKQPTITNVLAFNKPPEGTCTQEDFDYLRSKGFIVDAATQSYVNFFKKSTEYADTCINIRWEDSKWKCTVFRRWDTRNHDYDATFTPAYNSLQELLSKTRSDFETRASLMKSIE